MINQLRGGGLFQRPFLRGLGAMLLLTGGAHWAVAQGVIDQSASGGADLDGWFNLPTNTVILISGVTIDNSVSGSAAVFGSSRAWGLTNAATLNGNTTGVALGAGGSVNNQTGGRISGGSDGLDLLNGPMGVDNAGTISGGDIGLQVGHSGIVNNLAGGTIAGGGDGIFGFGGPQTIINAGTIIGTNNAGILYAAGGSVDNQSGGFITGNSGVFLNGGVTAVTNHGVIMGTFIGVNLFSGGSVVNLTGGSIVGDQAGVSINDSAALNNSGTIIGTNGDGAFMGNGGTVNNLRGGIIAGGNNGVDIEAVPGTDPGIVVNTASIIGTNNAGVFIAGVGNVNNQTGGTIMGGTYGVELIGGAGSLTNSGTIIGQSGTAVYLGDSDNTVTFQTGSDVRGDIAAGSGNNQAYLQGNGSYRNNFINFAALTVQADAAGWTLTGTNTFSTSTEVQSGLLRINGSLATRLLTVDPSWTGGSLASDTNGLGGAGVIIGDVDNHGYFQPDNSQGTLTILGSVTNWGNYYVSVTNNGLSGQLAVSGAATIQGGSVIVTPTTPSFAAQAGNAGVYAVQTEFNILAATNGVAGPGYASAVLLTNDLAQSALFPLTSSSLRYSPSNVTLVLNRAPFTSVASTPNQHSVAGALDHVGVTSLSPTLATLVHHFYWQATGTAARAALESLSGDIHGTLGLLDVQQQYGFNDLIAQRTGRMSANSQSGEFATSGKPIQLASAGPAMPRMQPVELAQPWEAWLQGHGTFGQLGSDNNAQGGNYSVDGLGGGVDYRLTPHLLAGAGAGYAQANADVGGPGAHGTVDDYQVAGYGGYVQGPWHLDGILSYGYLHADTRRFIAVDSLRQQANGKNDGGVFSLSTESGYACAIQWLTVEPTLGLNYAHLREDSFGETGTAADGNNYGLQVNRVDMDSVQSVLGIRLSAHLGELGGVQYFPALHVLWDHEWVDRTANMNAQFMGGSDNFEVHGVALGADTANLGGGLTVAFRRTLRGYVNFDAKLNAQIAASTLSGGLTISW